MPYVYYRKIMRHGGSLVVAIPRHIYKLWDLKGKDYLAVEVGHQGFLLIYPAREVNENDGNLPDREFIPDRRAPFPVKRLNRPRKT